jgi:hypothetical protein
MDPVGTSFQSATADLNDVAINMAAIMGKPHPLIKDENLFFKDPEFISDIPS